MSPVTAKSTPPSRHREQTPREEFANAASAGVGLALAIFGLSLLAGATIDNPDFFVQAGAVAYGLSLLTVAVTSTAYHAAPAGRWKQALRIADHVAIYALIAGTYSPFALGPLRGHGGGWLFLAEWALTLGGVVFVLKGGMDRRRWSNAFYLVMGWLGILVMPQFLAHVPHASLVWLLIGGLTYSFGVIFYSAKRLPFGHFVWHLFVIGGATCHFLAVLNVIP